MDGPDTADNLALLCGPCHKAAPDWPEPEEMARWIATRPARHSAEYENRERWLNAAAEVPEFARLAVAMAAGINPPPLPPGDPTASAPGEREVSEQMLMLLTEALERRDPSQRGLSQGTREALLRQAAAHADRTLSRLT